MDRETVIECMVEIATCGEHSLFAVEQLESELKEFGYVTDEVRAVLEVSLQARNERDVRGFAGALYDLLERRFVLAYLHDAEMLYAACLMWRN